MKCEICQTEYDKNLLKCPNCGLNNPKHQPHYCTNCGTLVEVGERFCSGCGASQIEEKPTNCKVCDAQLKPGAVFCTSCGTKVDDEAPVRTTAVSMDTGQVTASQTQQTYSSVPPVQEQRPVEPQYREEKPPITTTEYRQPQKHEYAVEPPEITSDAMGRPIRGTDNIEQPIQEKEAVKDPSPLMATVVSGSVIHNTQEKRTEEAQRPSTPNDPELAAELERRARDLEKINEVKPYIQQPETIDQPDLTFKIDDAPIGSERSLHDELFSSMEETPREEILKEEFIEEESEQLPKKKKSGKGIVIVLVLLILIMLGALAFIWIKLIPNDVFGSLKTPISNNIADSETLGESASGSENPIPKEPENKAAATGEDTVLTVKTVVEPMWEEVLPFSAEGLARVKIGSKWGIVDKAGNEIIEPRYNTIGEFKEGFAVVMDDKYGFINTRGELTVPMEYDNALPFSYGLALVVKNDKYLYIDVEGTQYDFGGHESTSFSEGVAGVNTAAGSYFMNTSGDKLSENFDQVGNFSEGLAPVKLAEKWGYVNGAFEEIIPIEYDTASSFSNGMAIVSKAGKETLINYAGDLVSPPTEKIWEYKEGMSKIKETDLYGYVNGAGGDYTIPPQYTEANNFSEGLASVKKDGKWYYINTNNEMVFDGSMFEEAGSFKDGVSVVKKDGKYSVINNMGKQIVDEYWDATGEYSNNLLPVMKDGKWGFVEISAV